MQLGIKKYSPTNESSQMHASKFKKYPIFHPKHLVSHKTHVQKVGTKQLKFPKTTPLWEPVDFYQRKNLH
jgi:hypothetical protein